MPDAVVEAALALVGITDPSSAVTIDSSPAEVVEPSSQNP